MLIVGSVLTLLFDRWSKRAAVRRPLGVGQIGFVHHWHAIDRMRRRGLRWVSLAICGVGLVAFSYPPLCGLAVGAAVAGAISNQFDVVRRGGVVNCFSAAGLSFNVADVAIVVGLVAAIFGVGGA